MRGYKLKEKREAWSGQKGNKENMKEMKMIEKRERSLEGEGKDLKPMENTGRRGKRLKVN